MTSLCNQVFFIHHCKSYRSIVFFAENAETFVKLGVLQKKLIVFFGSLLCFRFHLVDLVFQCFDVVFGLVGLLGDIF